MFNPRAVTVQRMSIVASKSADTVVATQAADITDEGETSYSGHHWATTCHGSSSSDSCSSRASQQGVVVPQMRHGRGRNHSWNDNSTRGSYCSGSSDGRTPATVAVATAAALGR